MPARRSAVCANATTSPQLSNTDPLTGLLNRRAVDQLLTRLDPDDALVVIDIDNFKSVNDRWGHAVGDELLIAFARAAQPLRTRVGVTARPS